MEYNFRKFAGLQGDSSFYCVMVKADGYGHGLVEIAQHLYGLGAKCFGVALIEEGIELRTHLRSLGQTDEVRILVFGSFDKSGCLAFKEFDLTPVVSSWDQIKNLHDSLNGSESMGIHLKFNTGMNRIGFDCEEGEPLKVHFEKKSSLVLSGVCSHLSNAEDSGIAEGYTFQQMVNFSSVVQKFSATIPHLSYHIYNSAGLIGKHVWDSKEWSRYGSRPGIALYGITPRLEQGEIVGKELLNKGSLSGGSCATQLSLRPVMSLHSQLVAIRRVKKGAAVSYGALWQAPRDSFIGTVAIGYGDGYPRQLSNKGRVLVKGKSVPVVGAVCMDYTLIDLTDVVESEEECLGEEVTLFGSGQGGEPTVEDLAELTGTISYEILTQIGRRVPRFYV